MYFRQPVYPYPSQSFPLQHDMSRNQTNRMTLEGEGRVTVTPDLAKINIGIATESPNVQQAQQENTRTSNQIIDALRRIGIHENDIKTASYSVFPRYDYVEGKSILRGYVVEHYSKSRSGTLRKQDSYMMKQLKMERIAAVRSSFSFPIQNTFIKRL